MMMERLSVQRRILSNIVLDTAVTKKQDSRILLSDPEWDIIVELSAVLKDMAQVTVLNIQCMCTETYVSFHK